MWGGYDEWGMVVLIDIMIRDFKSKKRYSHK
jgi:hypothetical protein